MGRRRIGVLGCLVVLAASSLIASSATATQAHSTRAHAVPHTTAPDLYVKVRVTITNEKFIVSRHSGPRGADAAFELHNISNKPHNFSIGNEKYGTGKQTGFTATLKPGQRKLLVLFLDIRGTIHYFPGLAADRGKAGMRGAFHIGPCSKYEIQTGVGEC